MAFSSPRGVPACEKDAKALQFIEDMTSNFVSVQEKVLEEILIRNADTEYLRRFNLNGATDQDTFKSKIPIVTYEDIQPSIQRIADGDKSPVLCAHPISEFLSSSGTSSGDMNLFPMTCEEQDRRMIMRDLFMPLLNLYVPDIDKGKALHFLFVREEIKTSSGLVSHPSPTSYYKSQQFQKRCYDVYTSPIEAILCLDHFQSMYTQMLCGLIMRDQVNRIGANFASALVRAIRFLQLNWKQLAHDIRTGTLNAKITDASIRKCMSKVLKSPNPDLADFITIQCMEEKWEGIITRIWTNTKYLDVIVTGAMAPYVPTLESYSGGLPMVCNRYCVGDILQMTGYYNSAPQFRFIKRKNVLLSVDVDKTDEVDLLKAIESASKLLKKFNTSVVEHTSYADTKTTPGHYVIYFELLVKDPTNSPPDHVLNRCSLAMEESLNSIYRQIRVDNTIGPLEIRVVKKGTFEEMMNYAISRGASINQYKVPRCVSFMPIIELSVHFNPTLPHWIPK